MKTPDVVYAVLSDIHGNYPALQQVDADARAQAQRLGCELRFICLGDVVDYGPFPNECMDWVVQTEPHITLQGNHDAEAIRPPLAETKRVGMQWFPITYWTRCALAATHRPTIEQWRGTIAGTNGLGEFLFFHGDPTGGDVYIEDCNTAKGYFPYLHSGQRYGLFGHTHFQTLFVKEAKGCAERFAQPEAQIHEHLYSWPVNTWISWPQRPLLVNPGSVGQPRFHTAQGGALYDKRACYLLLRRRGEGWEMQWRRVEYDYEATVSALGRLTWPQMTQHSGQGNDILKNGGDSARTPAFHLNDEQLEAQQARFSSVVGALVDHLLQRNGSDV